MTDFLSAFNSLSALSIEAEEELQQCLSKKYFTKGELLLKKGQVCKNLYFIDEGLTKTFFYRNDKEFIMRFFPAHSLFTVVDSMVTQTPSNYEVMALEKTTVTCITHKDLDALCKKYHCIETVFRKLVSIATINMMKRISEMLEENASERYKHFLKDNGHLLQHISLGDLANYLGITQVSLSRIRANK